MRALNVIMVVFLFGCSNDPVNPPLFTNVTDQSGVRFQNRLTFTERMNPYTYRNYYNGGGVALGDINNDGLLDIYFTGNQVDNKLYLNEGNLIFRDITGQAGVACPGVWSTGASFVDVNADGLLDLYVCKSGDPESPHRSNELFINNGDLTFTERAAEYGLDITGLSVQAAFFDFDKDDDLDCYLLTNSIKSVGNYDLVMNQRQNPDPLGGGNKLFINENGKFRDYSEESGIYRSNIGFGLGITLGDFNNDAWTDIFVSNDFFERDYLYINNRDGTFTESLTSYFSSISMGSMGADFADLDNDGISELFVTEMLPDSLSRRKTKTLYESWDKYQMSVNRGYHHQFPRNVLQKQVAAGQFAEIGRFAGVSASEWSWGALLFDMDNDGWKDIFIANGIYKDLLDRDYLAYTGTDDNIRELIRKEENAILKLIELMPSSQFSNYAFRNEGSLTFKNMANEWGLDSPMYSTGSAYGDLDNDGDLDLVVNNIDAPSVIFRNNTDTSANKSITFNLSSEGNNTMCVGSQIMAYAKGKVFVGDNFAARGFQSSVQQPVTIGLGEDVSMVDSVIIRWPDEGYTVFYNVKVNDRVHVIREKADILSNHPFLHEPDAKGFRLDRVAGDLFTHQGMNLVDFNRDRLLPMMYGRETPSLLQGDVDGDGTEEIYIGGGREQAGVFIDFTEEGGMKAFSPPAFAAYTLSEETRGALVDVDNDGDLDLYMASGGRFFPRTSSALADRIFLNDGTGSFHESPHALPFSRFFATSTVESIDFDNDGDADLLVTERFDPFVYGSGGRGFLLQNNGHGLFIDVTEQHAPALLDMGMITDVDVNDYNGDGWSDVLIVGDWMPIVMMQNEKGKFANVSATLGLDKTNGWWHTIASADLNGDGKTDFVLGNHGLNTFFKESDRMYVGDFDGNGSVEQIFCTKIGESYYPVVDKDEIVSQLPSFRKQLLYYRDYGRKSIDDLLPEKMRTESRIFEVDMLASIMLLSTEVGYEQIHLPREAQYSPIYCFLIDDFDNDGIKDVIAGGNQYGVKPQFGRYDASNGWFFKGAMANGQYYLRPGTDLNVHGEIRDIRIVEVHGVRYLLFAKHNDDVETFELSR